MLKCGWGNAAPLPDVSHPPSPTLPDGHHGDWVNHLSKMVWESPCFCLPVYFLTLLNTFLSFFSSPGVIAFQVHMGLRNLYFIPYCIIKEAALPHVWKRCQSPQEITLLVKRQRDWASCRWGNPLQGLADTRGNAVGTFEGSAKQDTEFRCLHWGHHCCHRGTWRDLCTQRLFSSFSRLNPSSLKWLLVSTPLWMSFLSQFCWR